jgi:alkylation response protein AidB-like acyl-CoA dehydrogenase
MQQADEANELRDYRMDARAWLAGNLIRRAEGTNQGHFGRGPEVMLRERELQQKLYDAGYAGFTFPKRYGGQGLTLDHERVFLEEAASYESPSTPFGVSINILGATLAEFGTEAQKGWHIPRILSGQELWLQLLSEPSGGSDLAGLRTTAVRDSEEYTVDGQKTWSSAAQFADFGLCPVRTAWDRPKHHGISVLIVDLRSPGIEIRPIRQINGEAHFCEEFLTGVKVPVSNLVGEENSGWSVIRGLLAIEHAWVGRGGPRRPELPQDVNVLVALAREREIPVNAHTRREIARLQVLLQVQEMVSIRVADGISAGVLQGGYGGLLKMGRDAARQRLAEFSLAWAGVDGVTWQHGDSEAAVLASAYLTSRSASIAGGTAEIVRNNVSEKVLNLPREQSQDRSRPFRDLPHN